MRIYQLAFVALVALSGCKNKTPPTAPPESGQSPADTPDDETAGDESGGEDAEDVSPDGEPDKGLEVDTLDQNGRKHSGDDEGEERDATPLVIDFLNAGQGDCIHIACPNGNSIVVDCGSKGSADPELDEILAALVLPAPEVRVVLTHQDADHYNRLADALADADRDKKIKAVYVGGPRTWLPKKGDPSSKKESEKLAAWLDSHDTTYPTQPFNGDDLMCGDEVKIDVLLAGYDATPGKPLKSGQNVRKNNASIVLKVERDGFGVLLAGDAYEAAENEILDSGKNVEAEVLKLGHHGAPDSTKPAWLAKVEPDHVITTAGHNNSYGHPNCAVLKRLPKLEGTDNKHSVECSTGKSKPWKTREFTESYWNSCEAGHLRLTVEDGGKKATLEAHTFPEDKVSNSSGKVCPARYQK